MSSVIIPVENLVISQCQQNTTLKATLAALPSTLPAVIVGTLYAWSQPVYPSLTFRISTMSPVKAFEDPLGGYPTYPVDDLRIDFEAWGQTDSTVIPTILDALDTMLRNQSFTLTTGGAQGGAATIFRVQQLTMQPTLYDKVTAAWYGVASYLFRVQR